MDLHIYQRITRLILLGFGCAIILSATTSSAKEPEKEASIIITTLTKGEAIWLPENGPDNHEQAVKSICNTGVRTTHNKSAGAKAVGDALIDALWSAVTKAVENYEKKFTRNYFAGKTINSFQIPLNRSKCIAISRMQVDENGKATGFYSLVVLQLVRNSKTGFVVRPLYVYTPVLKSYSNRNAAPSAAIAISIQFNFITKKLQEVEYKREISIASYTAGKDAKPFVFSRKKPDGKFRNYDDAQDSGLIPYHGFQPVTITLAVTEAGNGAKTAKKLKKFFDDNSDAILSKLKGPSD